jgi:hypothetical protein
MTKHRPEHLVAYGRPSIALRAKTGAQQRHAASHCPCDRRASCHGSHACGAAHALAGGLPGRGPGQAVRRH